MATDAKLSIVHNLQGLVFSCSGNGNGRSWNNRGSNGNYWSSTWNSARNARNLNFTNATAPVTLKIGEQEDGTAIYEDFDTEEKLTAFCAACNAHKQNALTAGWAEKDGIDWQPYEDYFKSEE